MSNFRGNIARALAIAIAVAAVIDPAIVTSRKTRPEIAVVRAPGDSTASRIARDLARTYTVLDGPSDAAQATIWLNRTAPAHASMSTPVFVVDNDGVTIQRIEAPRTMRLRESATIDIQIAPRSATKDIAVELIAGGHIVAATRGAPRTRAIPLAFTPSHTGITALRVIARDGTTIDTRDIAIDVRDERINVLVFDPAPSWQSTFIRRSIQQDARFVVTARTNIARGITSRAGQPPVDLQNAAALDAYDAVIAGSTTALDAASITALNSYMRKRSGVVMLLASGAKDAALQQLTNVAPWQTSADPKGITIRADSTAIISSEAVWPATLPQFATSIAHDAADHAIVWSMPAGGGQLIVNGAIDAWRFRDSAISAFSTFWSSIISAAVSTAHSPITLSTPIAAPRDEIEIAVRTDALQLETLRASVKNESGYATSVPLFREHLPVDGRTRFRGAFRAPSPPGAYAVTLDDQPAMLPATLVVTQDARTADPSPEILATWAAASGGRVISAPRIADLQGDLLRRIPVSVQRVPWHPMRSPWWIIPFALALSAEWYWRRRRGLA